MQGNWIAANWWQLLGAFVLIVGWIVQMANSITKQRDTKTELVELKRMVSDHLGAQGLHRGPDFELRMMNIEHQLSSAGKLLGVIDDDVKQILRSTKNKE